MTPSEIILTHSLHYDFDTIFGERTLLQFLEKFFDHWPFYFAKFSSLFYAHSF